METFGMVQKHPTPYHEQMTKVYNCYWLFGHNQIKKTRYHYINENN